MFTAYAVVSVLLALMLAGSATADFVRYKKIGLLMAERSAGVVDDGSGAHLCAEFR